MSHEDVLCETEKFLRDRKTEVRSKMERINRRIALTGAGYPVINLPKRFYEALGTREIQLTLRGQRITISALEQKTE